MSNDKPPLSSGAHWIYLFLLCVTGCSISRQPSAASNPLTRTVDVSPITNPSPSTTLFGVPDRGVRIVVMSDKPNINTSSTLKNELQRFVNALDPSQRFNILFFQDSCVTIITGQSVLLPANAANKRMATGFLDDMSGGGTADPVLGLIEAFRTNPDVIYYVADGDLPDREKFEWMLARLNANHHVRINTILFAPKADNDFLDLPQWLTSIARGSGGVYHRANEEDF